MRFKRNLQITVILDLQKQRKSVLIFLEGEKKKEALPQLNLVSHWLVVKVQVMPPSGCIFV